MTRLLTITVALLAAVGPIAAQTNATLEKLFASAEHKATVAGDLKGAIDEYQRIVKAAGKDRASAARALLAMADAYQRLGDAEARRIYERLLREFGEQSEVITNAKRRLQSLEADTRTGQASRRIVPVWTGQGVGYGTPSADGRYIPFRLGTGDLAIRDLVTNSTRELTKKGGWAASGDFVQNPLISPDNRFVAYTWFIEAGGMSELRVLTLEGDRPPRTLLRTTGRYPTPQAWTPDSLRLIVSHPTQGLGIMTVSNGEYHPLRSGEWPGPVSGVSGSADGRYIAYQSSSADSTSKRDIRIRALDGRGETGALVGPEDDFNPLWSPDGTHLVFRRSDSAGIALWAVRIQDGRPVGGPMLLRSDIGRMEPLGVTRNGSLYYAQTSAVRHEIYVAALDNLLATTSTLVGSQVFDGRTGPAWTPDGQLLTYWSRSGITLRPTSGGQERAVALPPGTLTNIASPKWFPDGRSLLLPIRHDVGFSLVRFHLDSGNVERLVNGEAASFAVAPDGGAIYWATPTGPDAQRPSGRLMRLDLQTREEQELKRDAWFLAIAVSPDGKELAYLRNDRTEAARSRNEAPGYLEIIGSRGGQSRQVFRDPVWAGPSRNNTLTWSTDQQNLLAVRDDGVLWRFPLNGGAPQSVGISANTYQFSAIPAEPLAAGDRRVKSPAVHPDGKTLAFAVAGMQDREIWSLENFLPSLAARK
jgi:Tol biopolymer transport system component